ncbi:MAG: 2-hydroxyacyl-CoA dehydratase family protein [Desulfobacterales bacterium]|nr:2-hydroxyacyl-CoA dehydratase family protein [Desulfobacterales bacterium]
MTADPSHRLAAAQKLKAVMARHFMELDEAARTRSKKIAWCTSVGPAELALAADFLVYYPENHAAILGANRTAAEYIPLANAAGFSPDICSYLTSDIGAYLKGETPLTRAYGIKNIPKPDLLLYNTNQCRDVYDWLSFYARRLKVPIIGINTPRSQAYPREDVVASCVSQLREIVPVLEKVSGRAFDIDRLREVLALSRECSQLWEAVLHAARTRPSPATFFDHCIHMGPAVVLRGTPEANAYYRILLEELKERTDRALGAVPEERHRLYWDGMPVWGKLRFMSETLSGLHSSVVASTYCNSWVFSDFDPRHPFRSMAKAYSSIFISQDDNYKENYIAAKTQQFGVEGIIYHDARTCPHNTNTRYGMPNRLGERLKMPYLIINGDLNDLRCFSEEQTLTNLEAFVEQLEESSA